jgi:hypothetical protein
MKNIKAGYLLSSSQERCRPTWSDNKVDELIAVKVLHPSLLNITAVAFKVTPLGNLHTDAST